MPIEIIIRNIKRSIRDYRIYFYTLILFSMIFYLFNAFDTSVTGGQFDIANVNIFVSLIFAFLLLYANLFMIRQRRPEFMTLSLLGMSVKSIILTLCIETCVVILLSLVIGLPGGILLSQLTNLFGLFFLYGSAAGYEFRISVQAVCGIISLYAIVIFFVCVLNILFVGGRRMYLLLKEDYVRSKRLPQTGYGRPVLLLAVSLLLVLVNRIILVGHDYSSSPVIFAIAFIFAIISIFLTIRAAFMYLNAFASSEKGNKYVFEVRFITDSGHLMSYFMTGVTVVILVSFVMVAGSFGMINNVRKLSMWNVPCDIQIFGDSGKSDIAQEVEESGIELDRYFSSTVQVDIRSSADITYGDFLGDDCYLFDRYDFASASSPVDILTLSQYNAVAELCGYDTVDLADDEFLFTSDIPSFRKEYNVALRSNDEIKLGGINLHSSGECMDMTVFLSLTKNNPGLIIVPDYVASSFPVSATVFMGEFRYDTSEDQILPLLSGNSAIDSARIETASSLREEYRDMALDAFYISLYMSFVLVICSLSVLSFKEVITIGSRSSMLKALTLMGFPDHEMRRYFACHITTIFSIPAIVSFIHSGYLIRAINSMVETVGVFDVKLSYLVFSLFLFPILIVFSIMTYKTSADLCFRVRSNTHGKY